MLALFSCPFTSPARLSKCFYLHSSSFLHLSSPQPLSCSTWWFSTPLPSRSSLLWLPWLPFLHVFSPHTWLVFSISFACFLSSTMPYHVWSLMLHLGFSLLYLSHNFVYTITYILMISTTAIPPWYSNSNWTLFAEYFNHHEVIHTTLTQDVQLRTDVLCFPSDLFFHFLFWLMALPSTDHFNRNWPIVHQYPCSVP